jgi:hypothetical protein
MFLERKNQGDHLQKFVYYIVLIGKETQELAALKMCVSSLTIVRNHFIAKKNEKKSSKLMIE